MPAKNWKTELNAKHAESLPLIVTSVLCVQILASLRDPIVIGWDLPAWLLATNAVLILIGAGLVLWVRSGKLPAKLSYPVASFAFFCGGMKAIASIVAQAEAIPFYMAILMLTSSLCFLSIRYSVFSMAIVLAAWSVVVPSVLSTGEVISSMAITLIGASLSVLVLHRRISGVVQILKLEQRVVTLESILPMCANCKKTRDHTGKWQSIERYIEDRQVGTQVSHGSCPDCTEELYGDLLRESKQEDSTS